MRIYGQYVDCSNRFLKMQLSKKIVAERINRNVGHIYKTAGIYANGYLVTKAARILLTEGSVIILLFKGLQTQEYQLRQEG
jgi:hypothetical protein